MILILLKTQDLEIYNMIKTFTLTPNYTCPELVGYKLPSFPRSQEDDIEAMAKEEFNNIDNPIRSGIDNHSYKTGFTEGYHKAREKYEFSREDMINFAQWVESSNEANMYDRKNRLRFEPMMGGNPESVKRMPELLELYLNRRPIAIEVEMVEVKVNPMGRIVDLMDLTQNQSSCTWQERPDTNPDGTVKGRWVYE